MIIQSKRVWIASQFLAAQLKIENGKIITIYKYNERTPDHDFGDRRIVPGFIDIHTHGAYGFDTNYAEEAGLKNWLKNIVKDGVTGLCPTTLTQSKENLTKAVTNVAKVYKDKPEGAHILGIHFEGPYLDQIYKGAQPEQYIIQGSIDEFEHYQNAAEGLIKIITIATEHDPNFALTHYLSERGIAVSIGHSGATYDEACMAIANGASSMTHIFNGMTAFNHRENGLVGAAMRFKDVFGEVICDGNHSTWSALNILFSAKGGNSVIMITDSLMAKGSPVGSKFDFGGNEIEIYPDGSAHLTATKGLAGSTLRINEGLRNLVEKAMVPFHDALNSCTINPARLLHIDNQKGRIVANYDADLVVLNDDYSVEQTFVAGKAML